MLVLSEAVLVIVLEIRRRTLKDDYEHDHEHDVPQAKFLTAMIRRRRGRY